MYFIFVRVEPAVTTISAHWVNLSNKRNSSANHAHLVSHHFFTNLKDLNLGGKALDTNTPTESLLHRLKPETHEIFTHIFTNYATPFRLYSVILLVNSLNVL